MNFLNTRTRILKGVTAFLVILACIFSLGTPAQAERAQMLEWYVSMVEKGSEAKPVCYLKYKLERCFVKSWSTSGDADDRPTEEVAFYYNKIAFSYQNTKDGATFASSYDLDSASSRDAEWADIAELYQALPKIGAEAIRGLEDAGADEEVVALMADFLDALDGMLYDALKK